MLVDSNAERLLWVFVLLQQFSVDIAEKASNVCLAHLFTYQDFDEGTLGLAYVAPSKPDIPGGLCSKGRVSVTCLSFIPMQATNHSLLLCLLSVSVIHKRTEDDLPQHGADQH